MEGFAAESMIPVTGAPAAHFSTPRLTHTDAPSSLQGAAALMKSQEEFELPQMLGSWRHGQILALRMSLNSRIFKVDTPN